MDVDDTPALHPETRQPLRIAHVVEATTGGVARHVLDLATRLDPTAFTPLLYLSFVRPDSWREAFYALRAAGITLRAIPMSRVPNSRVVKQLAAWSRLDAVDLLHVHSAKAGMLGRQAAHAAGLPVLYTPHAFPFQRTTDWRRPFYRLAERRMAALTDGIICVSEGEREEALAAGLPEEKLLVVPNGIDLAQWPPATRDERRQARAALGLADGEVAIGTLARLVPQKGLDLLLLAMAEELQHDYPQARIFIWGDGPEQRSLAKIIARLRLRRVQLLPATRDPRTALLALDIYCAPSRWEAGPYAVLEAMACGLPVVASNVAGHSDYVEHERTGLLVEPELPGPLAGALAMLLADADLRDGFAQLARARVERHFPLSRMLAHTAALYRHLAAPSPPAPLPEERGE